jgi:hypothetical protein
MNYDNYATTSFTTTSGYYALTTIGGAISGGISIICGFCCLIDVVEIMAWTLSSGWESFYP